MRKLALRWIISAVAVYAAERLVSGFDIGGDWLSFFLLALFLGLANALIAPILNLLTCPLIILTLGLFTLVINGVLLLVAIRVGQSFGIDVTVTGFGDTILAALVISIVSTVLSLLTGVNRKDRWDRREDHRR